MQNLINVERSPSQRVNKLIKEGFGLNLDMSDMPVAKNVLEWFIGEKFFNLGNTRDGKLGRGPYAKQIQMALQLREDYCPDCTDSRLVINNKLDLPVDLSIGNTLDRVVLLEHGICPKCKRTRLDFLKEGKFCAPHTLIGRCGLRSGKSTWICMDCSYSLHRILTISNPQEYYKLSFDSPLFFIFTASAYCHANESLWQPFKVLRNISPWFSEYHKLLKNYEEKLGENLFYDEDDYYFYKHVGIAGFCEAPEKLHEFIGLYVAIDEGEWLTNSINSQASIDIASYNNLAPIRSATENLQNQGIINPLSAYMINMSSVSDRIPQQAIHADRHTIFTHYATWEFNPSQPFKKLRNAHREDSNFWRDFGAVYNEKGKEK